MVSARGVRWWHAPMVVAFVRASAAFLSRRFPGVYRVHFRNRQGHKQLSRTWFIRYTVKGKQVRESTGKTDPEEAWNIRQERVRAVEQGRACLNPRLVLAEDLRKLVYSNLDAQGKVTAKRSEEHTSELQSQ